MSETGGEMLQKPPPPSDPDEAMRGTCATCELTVLLERWQAMPPAQPGAVGREPNTFGDLWSCACPGCSARVYVVPCRSQGG